MLSILKFWVTKVIEDFNVTHKKDNYQKVSFVSKTKPIITDMNVYDDGMEIGCRVQNLWN